MSERLNDVEARIGSVHQLSSVISAMQGIAAARLREANAQLDATRSYAATVDEAINLALALLPPTVPVISPQLPSQHRIVIALCAEQGFAGTFNAHVLDAARRQIIDGSGPHGDLLLVGDRGVMIAGEMELDVSWSIPMAAHTEEVTNVANRLVEALYARLGHDLTTKVTIVYAAPEASQSGQIVEKILLPFDYEKFAPQQLAQPPLITLAPYELLAELAEEYVFAELCEAVLLSFAAENEARMRTMIAAHANVEKKLTELSARARLLRQEQITSEVIELAAGVILRKKTSL